MKWNHWTNGLTTLAAAGAALALGVSPASAQEGHVGTTVCSCISPSTLNQMYSVELRMSPTQSALRHCAVAPTFLDMEQSVVQVRNRKVATGQNFGKGVVNTAPETKIKAQFLVYIASNPKKAMASCEVKTVRNEATTRDDVVAITHQQAAACMEEIQTSRTWTTLCTDEVLKRP